MKGYTYDEFIADSRTLYHSKEKMRKIKKNHIFFQIKIPKCIFLCVLMKIVLKTITYSGGESVT